MPPGNGVAYHGSKQHEQTQGVSSSGFPAPGHVAAPVRTFQPDKCRGVKEDWGCREMADKTPQWPGR